MIIIKLQGGLGNQMFQYAFGRNLSVAHGATFKIDPSYLEEKNQSGRTLRINGFNILDNTATKTEIAQYRSLPQKIMDRVRPALKKRTVTEVSPEFDPTILKHTDGYFIGHWNDELYFKPSEKIIRKEFSLKNPLGPAAKKIVDEILSEHESVSIHVRRDDYVSIPKVAKTHGTLPLSYYEKAIRMIEEKAPKARFFVSSDDIVWVKENFPKHSSIKFVSSSDIPDHEELVLMSLCKHNIIANSTFSWWAAWLNTNSSKIVIAPKQWFSDPSHGTAGLIPKTWLQI